MALTIKENNGIFLVKGIINTVTAKSFQAHFETILNVSKTLTIDINKVSEIDVKGLNVLKILYRKAQLSNRSFYIIGNGCKEIIEDFRYTSAI